MTEEKNRKVMRVLNIYQRLIRDEVIYKKQLAITFGVNEKTIQRDIEDIRAYLANNIEDQYDLDVEYRRDKGGYCLNKIKDIGLNKKAVLAISKILLESRAFCKEEIDYLICALLGEIDNEQKKCVKELIGNELLNFVPVKHNEKLLEKIWNISDYIRHKELVEITYVKTNGKEVERILKPLAVIFSEYYFYLIAYFNDLNFDNPAVFRIDRIKNYKGIEKKFNIPESNRFEDGQFRNKIQFMYSGKLERVKFEVNKLAIEAVLDRLPTAKIISRDSDKYFIEAEVFGKGIIMWILSQGSKIKVLSPEHFVRDIAYEANKIKELYETY